MLTFLSVIGSVVILLLAGVGIITIFIMIGIIKDVKNVIEQDDF